MSKPYSPDGIQSMVNYLGDNKLLFQPLRNSMTDIKTTGEESSITFVTESSNLHAKNVRTGKGGKLGLILWIDEKDYEEWYNQKG